MSKIEKVTKTTDNRFLNMYDLDVVTKTGHKGLYHVASRAKDVSDLKLNTHVNKPDGVIIYALYGEKREQVVLIRQYRFSIGGYIYEFPAGLVDVAIILNMSLSMMILVITMTIREPLEFSIFPSLLLITTLFRLGINVSTTRNILSQGGSSGRVIAAFGDFVLRGNVVVGLIIFLIIVLMQFIDGTIR